ncbi:MAG: SAM-dependent methyltransferase [Bacteroidales bacterium]|jgi:hypothetical protein|nr:SAM-dependent methyltransferase [Bacteroidales bacterium]
MKKTVSTPDDNYSADTLPVLEAQRLAHLISFGPVVFQVARLMNKFGILRQLLDSADGLTTDAVAAQAGLTRYAAQVLLESSLTMGIIHRRDDRYLISKAGWFLLNDPLIRVDIDFNHDVNYQGLFNLEEALLSGKPAGLRVFGDWPTIYEGLSKLPPQVQKSWFAFDHYYSDETFEAALPLVFECQPDTLLDVGGNTGRWAMRCVDFCPDVRVTVMDLPQQLELMRRNIDGHSGADRIDGHGINLLNPDEPFPTGFGAIWMSQFLDCFSEAEVISILSRAVASMDNNAHLFIMEPFWDRQRFEAAAFCLTQISLYFTALANGNSKMYHSDDMRRCVETAGLTVEAIHDGLGKGHSLMICRKK